MPKYTIEDAKIACTQEEMMALYRQIKPDDIFGEYLGGLVEYLTFATVQTAGILRAGITAEEWGSVKGDEDLRSDMFHYRDWWREKVTEGRGLSCHRGKAQFCLRMALAGMPEWESIFYGDGGWYQEDAYNAVGELFGWPPVEGYRD